MFCNVLLLLELFNKTISNSSKNFGFFARKNILPKLPLNILSKKPSNLFIKPSDKNNGLKKIKPIATIISWDLGNLGYITDQFVNAKL